MLEIMFELENVDDVPHEFDLGHISLLDGDVKITSKNKAPSQSMMIFLSVSNFLFIVRSLLQSNKKSMSFTGDDSSFTLLFKEEKGGLIQIYEKGKVVFKVEPEELIRSLWVSSKKFYDKYANLMEGSGAAKEDWDMAMDSFYRAFEYLRL